MSDRRRECAEGRNPSRRARARFRALFNASSATLASSHILEGTDEHAADRQLAR